MCEDFLQESSDGLSKVDGEVLPLIQGHLSEEHWKGSRALDSNEAEHWRGTMEESDSNYSIYLAETITGLLVDETNAALLTEKFWVQNIYTELLFASCRFRAVREKEQQRPPNSLVKVVCLPFPHRRMAVKKLLARFETMIGPSS